MFGVLFGNSSEMTQIEMAVAFPWPVAGALMKNEFGESIWSAWGSAGGFETIISLEMVDLDFMEKVSLDFRVVSEGKTIKHSSYTSNRSILPHFLQNNAANFPQNQHIHLNLLHLHLK
jgi:hypothetical protein